MIRKYRLLTERAVALIPLLISLGCGAPVGDQPTLPDIPLADRLSAGPPIDDPATIDDVGLDLPHIEPAEWVNCYLPERCFNGYNLVLYRRRVPILIDMNGRMVHAWTQVRSLGRTHLDHQGRLSVIGRDNIVKEYDWDGNLTWFYRAENPANFPHHDFTRVANGHYLVLIRDTSNGHERLREIDRSGRVVWRWRSEDHVPDTFPDLDLSGSDPVHINSVRELPPNRWFDEGDQRFRPGNILVSARNLDSILVIDRKTGDIVWKFSDGLDYQHEAIMVPPDQPGKGLIAVFNNGWKNLHAYRQSALQMINPIKNKVVWEYKEPGFYSSVAGTVMPLANGNVLFTSSESGRASEVTVGGEVVWEWVPPYLPMRVERLAFDHCPQFAGIKKFEAIEVPLVRTFPFIDLEVYAFTIPEEQESLTLHGRDWWVIPENNGCRELWLPSNAAITFDYGLNHELLGGEDITAHFTATMTSRENGVARVLLDDTVASTSDNLWRWHKESLAGLDFHKVDLCIATDYDGSVAKQDADDMIVWVKPRIRSRDVRTYRDGRPAVPMTDQEQQLKEQQLKALGYVQ